MMNGYQISGAIVALALATSFGLAEELTTDFDGNLNGDEGCQFDIRARTSLRITGIQIAFQLAPLSDWVEVFTKHGTHVGSETTQGDWTLNATRFLTVTAAKAPSPVILFDQPLEILTSKKRHRVYGVASDDGEINRVRIRYRKERANGSKKTITRFVKVFPGRNQIRLHAFDTQGKRSKLAKIYVTRK